LCLLATVHAPAAAVEMHEATKAPQKPEPERVDLRSIGGRWWPHQVFDT